MEETRYTILGTNGEAADGKHGAHIPDYTLLAFDHLDKPHGLSEATQNGELDRT